MAIVIDNYTTLPALEYKYVHASGIQINLSEDQVPKARVAITYKLYALDGDGKKHFAKEQYTATVEDFYVLAMTLAQGGDMTGVTALQGIEQAVAHIIASQNKHGAATVE